MTALASPTVASAETTAMLSGLNSWAGLSEGLGSFGALGNALPLVATTPGGSSALEFAPSGGEKGLFDLAFYQPLKKKVDDLIAANTKPTVEISDLDGTYTFGASPDRAGTLHATYSTSGTAQQLKLDLTVTRTINTALEVSGGSSGGHTINLATNKGVQIVLTFNATFYVAVDKGLSDYWYILHGGSFGPTMTVAATESIPDITGVHAGIGILGMVFSSTPGFAGSENLAISLDDPNSDGKLAFKNSDGTTGELGQSGALTGLAHVAFGTPAGSVDNGTAGTAATFSLTTDNSLGLGLPTVSTTISVLWTDVSQSGPTITADSHYADAGDFLNMTPKDILQGLAHLENTIEAAERAQWKVNKTNPIFGNISLPFMKGTLADAIDATHVLNEFIADNTNPDGSPAFASLQGLISAMKAFPPASQTGKITVNSVHFNDLATSGANKVLISLTITESRTGVPVDVKVGSNDPATGAGNFGNVFSAAGIVNANSNTSTATADESYTSNLAIAFDLRNPITGTDCKTAADFPQYPERTASGCPFSHLNPDGTTTLIQQLPNNTDRFMLDTGAPGPFIEANFPVTSKVVGMNAMVGYLGVQLDGQVSMDASSTDKMWTISLVPQSTNDGTGDLTLDQVAALLVTDPSLNNPLPSTFLTETVKAKASASLAVSVPMSSTGSTPSYFGKIPPTITVANADITGAPSAADVSTLTNPDLKDFAFDPTHPQSLLTPFIKSLQVLDGGLAGIDKSSGLLSTEIPVLGRSVGSLLAAQESNAGPDVTYDANSLTDASRPFDSSADKALVGRSVLVGTQVVAIAAVSVGAGSKGTKFTFTRNWTTKPADGSAYALNSSLAAAAAALAANPPASLQDALTLVNKFLGAGSTFTIAGIDTSSGTPQVILKLDSKRSAHTYSTLAVSFKPNCNTGCPVGVENMVASSKFPVPISVTEDANVGFLVPLATGTGPADASALKVLDSSTLGGTIQVNLDDTSSPSAVIGPLAVKLGNGTDHLQVMASYALSLTTSGGTQGLDSFLAKTPTATAPGVTCPADSGNTNVGLCAVIPVYEGTTSVGPVIIDLPTSGADMFVTVKSGNNTAGVTNAGQTQLGDDIAAATINLNAFLGGIDSYLAQVQQLMAEASFDGKVPFVGNDIQEGSDSIGQLKTELDNDVNTQLGNLTAADTVDTLNTRLTNFGNSLSTKWPGSTLTPTVYCGNAVCANPSTDTLSMVTRVELTMTVGPKDPVGGIAPPINVGIPGLSLHSSGDGGFTAMVQWKLDVVLGVDLNDGFYVKADGGNHVFTATATISPPNSGFTAQLAFLTMNFKNGTAYSLPAADPDCKTAAVCLTANVDLSQKLTLKDLANASSAFSVQAAGHVRIDWRFDVTVAANGDGTDNLLPGLGGDFVLTWNFTASGGSGLQAGTLYIAFYKVDLDLGTFLSGVFGDIMKEVKFVTDPLRPVIDTIEAPIPVLSDLSHLVGGGDVTIESIAEAFNTLAGGPDLTLVTRLTNVLHLIDSLPTCSSSCKIALGTFELTGTQAQSVLDTSNTPTYASDPNTVGKVTPDGSYSQSNFLKDINQGSSFFADPSGPLQSNCASDPNNSHLTNPSDTAGKAGLWFPFLDDPIGAFFAILMNSDVTIACFDSGKLSLGFSYSQAFGPVYAPPPVLITIAGSASIGLQIVGGFDTYGVRTAAELPDQSTNPVRFLSSLFFATTDTDGNPLPVVSFTGKLSAGAEVSAVIISVNVNGGISLTVSFLWNDPDNDGKFRFDEFAHAALSNALCLFKISGEFSVFLDVGITIGIGPFSTSFDINLVNVKLLDFNLPTDCNPAPPTLASEPTNTNTLVLYAGKLATESVRGKGWGSSNFTADETWKVTEYYDPADTTKTTGFAVDALGFHYEFPSSVDTVLLDGRGYNGSLTVIFQGGVDPSKIPPPKPGQPKTATQVLPFRATAIVFGGNKNDVIKTGQGENWIDGGGGDDTINTGDVSNGATSNIAGGPGNDSILVGDANNNVAGDSALTITGEQQWGNTGINIFDWTKKPGFPSATDLGKADPIGGNDTIDVGLGGDTVWGNGGDDHINVAPDPSGSSLKSPGVTIIGGDGSDSINGGDGSDYIYTGEAKTQTGVDETGSADVCVTADQDKPACPKDAKGVYHPVNTVNTGGGYDPKTGDRVDGGSDHVFGGTGIDIVSGHSGLKQVDDIRGGAGEDVLSGGYGADTIYGGPDDDYVIAEPSDISDVAGTDTINGAVTPFRVVTHLALPPGVTSSNKTLVGGAGDDHIIGGDGPAEIFGDYANEYGDPKAKTACRKDSPPQASVPIPDETGQKTNSPADGNDRIQGGAGNDDIQAGGGDDIADSGTGFDFVCGGAGNDTLTSHSLVGQSDIAYGGSDNDTITGGDGGDYLFGNTGSDVIWGYAGNDTLEGNEDFDIVIGGTGDDLVIGGTSAAGKDDTGDWLFGDIGNDVLIGDNGALLTNGVADMSKPGVNASNPTVWSFDLAEGNGSSSTHGGPDFIWAGDGADIAYGGLDKDTIFGGANDDHLEGGPGTDTIYGEAGQDDLIGGSSQIVSGLAADMTAVGFPDTGDIIYGGDDPDVVLADNGSILRNLQPGFDINNTRFTKGRFATPRTVLPYDLGDTPAGSTSGNDFVDAGLGDDAILGQGGDDRLIGGNGADYIEGGPGQDWLEGDAGEDDLVGGSSFIESVTGNAAVGQPDGADLILGGADDDAMAGDNAQIISLAGTGQSGARLFQRLGSTGSPIRPRTIILLDLNANFLTPPSSIRYGDDQIDGGAGNDLAFGQDGNDSITGGTGDDYVQGNGGTDTIKGDLPLDQYAPDGLGISAYINPSDWAGNSGGLIVPGYTPPLPGDVAGTDGTNCAVVSTHCQDDLIGGSALQGFRDGYDFIEGDYGDDFILGDNGTLVRDVVNGVETTFTQRSPNTTIIRHHDDSIFGLTSTRFCTTAQATCEPAGAFGGDILYGDSGNDNMWGEDGNDVMSGGTDNDDMYGELGNDIMDGGPGQDVMLGDRGGAVDNLEDGSRSFTNTLSSAPQETYVGLAAGTYDRMVDLLHDVDGASFVGTSTSAPMPHNGMTEGGDDVMVGGPGHDSMHGGAGNDVMDGDAGGDIVFGDDGADVLYGGQGCDPNASPANQDLADLCPTLNGAPDLSNRGTNDRWLDYVFGGKGGTDAVSQAGDLGADLIDFAPRGTAAICTLNPWPVIDPDGTIHDPCTWFMVTMRDQSNYLVHQDHQGTDWLYGGWDRDVLQGDVAANGPNPGDRLIDWTGAFNLYTHCNAAYGGYNDIRQISAPLLPFIRAWAWGSGAGQSSADANTSGTSAFDEVAIVYSSDNNAHGAGSAYPTTPGHFDNPSCTP